MCVCFLSACSLVPFTVHPHGLSQRLWFFLYWSCEVPKSLKHTGPSSPHLNNKRLLCQGPLDLPPLHKYVRIKEKYIFSDQREKESERLRAHLLIGARLMWSMTVCSVFAISLSSPPGCPWLPNFKNLFVLSYYSLSFHSLLRPFSHYPYPVCAVPPSPLLSPSFSSHPAPHLLTDGGNGNRNNSLQTWCS